tara:strand:- start:1420 stop:1578 length:159 start_codon:yes stop_codon:yes gene_type:complete
MASEAIFIASGAYFIASGADFIENGSVDVHQNRALVVLLVWALKKRLFFKQL